DHVAAPVVPDEHALFDFQRVHQPDKVCHQVVDIVLLQGRRPVALTVTAQVNGDDMETGLGQRRDLMPPGVPGFGKAVHQDQRIALALLHVVQGDAVDVGALVLPDSLGGHAATSSYSSIRFGAS